MSDERWTELVEYLPRPRRVRVRRRDPDPRTLVPAEEIEAFIREQLGAAEADRPTKARG